MREERKGHNKRPREEAAARTGSTQSSIFYSAFYHNAAQPPSWTQDWTEYTFEFISQAT